MKIFKIISLVLLGIIVLWVLWPSEFKAVSWTPAPIPELIGPYAKNDLLDDLKKKFAGQCHGCEDLALDSSGVIYTGDVEGNIFIFEKEQRSLLANTGGRPLGMDLDKKGNLIVADAHKGLLSIEKDGKISLLTNSYNNLDFMLTDDVEVGADGIFYFTDASSKYGVDHSTKDLVEHGGNGRLLSYNPATGGTELLMDDLQFANGVAVEDDASFVLVNATGSYCVYKYWLKGPEKGTYFKLIDNLPGYPDNISNGSDGIYWLTLVAPRDPQVEKLMPLAWLRNLIMKLPASVSEPKPNYYGMILGVNGDGEIIYNYQDSDPNLVMITSVEEHGNYLYMGSLTDDGIGVMEIR